MMNKGTCIHFNGVHKDECKKGIPYAKFGQGMPCIQTIEFSASGGTYLKAGEVPAKVEPFGGAQPTHNCAMYQEPTDEDIRADREDMDMHFAKTIAAIKVAGKWRVKPKPKSDRADVVECPVCKGKLHLSQSSYNGHVHGKCETKDCVSWME